MKAFSLNHQRHRSCVGILLFISSLLCFNQTAIAVDATWNGGTGFWSVNTNWTPNTIPNGSTYDVFIDGGKTGTDSVVNLNTTATVGNLTIDTGDMLNNNNGGSLYIYGPNVTNNGTLQFSSTGAPTDLRISGAVTFAGTGTVTVGNHVNNRLFGVESTPSTNVLTNALGHTIQGGGQLGLNYISLNNQGLIVANQPVGMTMDLMGNRDDLNHTNTGALRAASGSTLSINNSGFNNTGGTLEALDTSTIALNNTRINGGTLTTAGSGLIQLQNNSVLNNVINSGLINVANGQNGILEGTLTNNGTLQFSSTGAPTDLRISGAVTFAGSGTVTVGNHVNNRLFGVEGTPSTNVLTNSLGHTIQGGGQIGLNYISLDNQGLIVANQPVGMTMDLWGNRDDINSSNSRTLRAASGSTLTINTSGINNAGGILEALDTSTIALNNTRINSGTLTTAGSGVIQLQNGSVLNNVTNSGLINIGNGQNTLLENTFTNNGTLQFSSTGATTDLRISRAVTFAGTGTVTVGNHVNNRLFGVEGTPSTNVLTNSLGHTIQGGGQIGLNYISINNQGLIVADQPVGITMDLWGGRDDINHTNTGTLRAASGSTLTINTSGINNAGGILEALDTSTIALNNTRINSGTLTTAGSGVIQLQNGSVLNNVTNSGLINIGNGQNTLLENTFTNNGTLQFSSTGSPTDLRISGAVTFAGTGSVTMGNTTNNRLFGVEGTPSSNILTNSSGHTIQGGGQIGLNYISINNQGLILANQTTNLVIDPNPTAGLTNSGTLQTNAGSTLQVTDSLTNYSGTTLTGGIYNVYGTAGSPGNMQLPTGNILTNAATILLDGLNSNLIQSNGTDALTNFNTNAAAGSFTIQNGRNFTTAGAFGNAGIAQIGLSSTFTTNGAFTNTGADTKGLQLRGGTFNAISLANSGEVNGFGTIGVQVNNTGIVRAFGGTLNADAGISGATGTVQIDYDGVVALGAASTAGNLIHNGNASNSLNLGTNNITVYTDYHNANFGTGNSFNRRANVTGTGLILASGTSPATAQQLSGDLTGGPTSGNATIAFGNVHVGDSVTKNYQVGNANTGGPSLRGAIQTTVNGGNINDSRLSGSGVTASNWGPIAPGANTGNLSVLFNATSSGLLIGQKVNILNNFDNTNSQLLSISGAAYNLASAGAHSPEPVNLGNVRAEGTFGTQALSISNTAPNDGFSEQLNASTAPTTGPVTATGSFNGLTAGSTNNSSLVVGISDTATAGLKTGTATITLASDGTGTSGLGVTALSSQTVNISGKVFRLASPNTLAAVNFGVVHVGDVVQQPLSIINTAANDGFSEKLNASFGGVSDARILTSGSINLLAPGSTNNTNMLVGLNTSSVGNVNGTVTVNFQSDGTGTSGLGTLNLPSQNVPVNGTISATVLRLANPLINTTQPVNLGNVRIGTVAQTPLSITNDVPNDGFSESLLGNSVSASTGITVSGSFGPLAPSATDNSSIVVGINTATAGAKSGTAKIKFQSDGTSFPGGTITDLGNQDVSVQGNVYRLANPTLNTPSVTLAARIGDSLPTAAVSITNTSPDIYTEGLKAGISTSSPGFTAGGNISNLGAGQTNVSSLQVGLSSTATAGTFNGSATLALASTGAGTTGAPDLSLPDQNVSLTGKVYTPAIAQVDSTTINFGIVHKGDVVASRALTVTNAASVTALNDVLQGSFGGASAPFTASGTLGAGLAAGASNNSSLSASLNTTNAGIFNSNATASFLSYNPDMADLSLSSVNISLQAQVNNYANPVFDFVSGDGSLIGSGSLFTLDFGNVLQFSGTETALLQVLNDTVGPADLLDGNFEVSILPDFVLSGFNAFTGLDAGESFGGLSVGLDTSALGFFTNTITLYATGYNGSGYSGEFDPIQLVLRGNIVEQSIPEPSTILLVGAGLVGIGMLRKRSKK